MAAISRPKQLSPLYPFLRLCSFSSSSSSYLLQSPPNQTPEDKILISDVVSILKQQKSKSRWNFIKTLYPNGFSPKQVSEITLNLRNNPHLAHRFFLWTEKKSLCTHDLLSYSTIIHILARARFKSQAQTLIQTAVRVSEANDPDISSNLPKIFETLTKTYRYCDSAPFVFDLLIKSCLQAKKIDSTVEIVRMLRSRGIYPNISTCNLVIRMIFQLRGSEAGLGIYREIFNFESETRVRVCPNVRTFNTIMLCLYQDGNLDMVGEFWNEMEKFDCKPNVFSYSVLITTFCDERKMGEAMRLFEEMLAREVRPDVMVYNTLIKGFCESGEIGRAEEVFGEMRLSEIEATCLTYEYMMKGYCKVEDVYSAIVLYKDMCRKDFQPEASTVEEVIKELCDKNRVYDGASFLRDVMRTSDFYPSESTYVFLIRGLCMEGEMEEALKLQTEMVAKGFVPNLEIYSAFIEGYSKQEDYEQVRILKKEMIEFGLKQE